MNPITLYMGLAMTIFLMGLHGLLTLTDPLRRLIAVNLMSSGTFLVMVALASRSDPPDPVLHALVVTGLVVAISATAFALRLVTASLDFAEQSETPGTERPGTERPGTEEDRRP